MAVNRALLPHRGDLPEDIAALNDAQGYELGVDVMWRPTVGKLLDDLSDLLRDRATTRAGQPSPSRVTPRGRRHGRRSEIGPTRSRTARSGRPTIFISYMREDADAARRLCDAITESRRGCVAGRATATRGRCMGAGDSDRDPPNCPVVRPDHLGEHRAGAGRLRFPGVDGGGRAIALHYAVAASSCR